MNDLAIELAMDPCPFRHYLVRRRHPMFPWLQRDACLCGFRSPWLASGHTTDHPHGVVTRSRTDLRPVPTQGVNR